MPGVPDDEFARLNALLAVSRSSETHLRTAVAEQKAGRAQAEAERDDARREVAVLQAVLAERERVAAAAPAATARRGAARRRGGQ